jgi:hypothetical protein
MSVSSAVASPGLSPSARPGSPPGENAPVSPTPPPDYRVYRLTTGRLVAVILMFAVAFGALDTIRRGAFVSTLPGLLFMLGGCALSYAYGLRPAVLEGIEGVVVRNPLRTARVPWTSVTAIDVTDVLRVHAGATEVRCFALPRRRPPATTRSSPRSVGPVGPAGPASGEPVADDAALRSRSLFAGPAPAVGRADDIAVRLRRMAERAKASGAPPGEVEGPRLAVDAVVALVLAAALAVAGVVGAAL